MKKLLLGPFGIALFWIAVLGAVYLGMQHYLQPKPMVITMQGDLLIPRDRNGHFYATGSVNGQPVQFLVDTGASSVAVSEAFAQQAGLNGGEPVTLSTANGQIQGRTLRNVPVSVGPVAVSGVTVSVGLIGRPANEVLLGQSFLSKFQVTMNKEEMILRRL